MRASSWNQISTGLSRPCSGRMAGPARVNFFKNVPGCRSAARMLRPDRKPHMAQSLELFADRAFVQLYAEYLLNAPLQIGAPPPHYAVFVIIRTFLDKSGEFGFLRCGQPAGPSWCFAVFKPRQTFCIIA